jgi:hypothetical protein
MDAKPPQAVRDVFRKKKAVRDVDRSISWPLVKTRPAVVQSSRDRGHGPKGDGFHSIQPLRCCIVSLYYYYSMLYESLSRYRDLLLGGTYDSDAMDWQHSTSSKPTTVQLPAALTAHEESITDRSITARSQCS